MRENIRHWGQEPDSRYGLAVSHQLPSHEEALLSEAPLPSATKPMTATPTNSGKKKRPAGIPSQVWLDLYADDHPLPACRSHQSAALCRQPTGMSRNISNISGSSD